MNTILSAYVIFHKEEGHIESQNYIQDMKIIRAKKSKCYKKIMKCLKFSKKNEEISLTDEN